MPSGVFADDIRICDQLNHNYDIDSETGCWNWNKSRDSSGYGKIWVSSRVMSAHRYYYEVFVGVIPKDMVVHHKCENKACVNPSHLEIKTNKENILLGSCAGAINARKTHCPHGHKYTLENTGINSYNGQRFCRTCRRKTDQLNSEKVNKKHRGGRRLTRIVKLLKEITQQ